MINLLLLLLLVSSVSALSKSTLKHGNKFLLYNTENDCFVSIAPSQLCHAGLICDSNLELQQNPQSLKYKWFFSAVGIEEVVTYDTVLHVNWNQDQSIARYLHVHHGDHGQFHEYNNFRQLYMVENGFLKKNVHVLSGMSYYNKNIWDRWKVVRVDSETSKGNVETMTKVRFNHAKTNHYLFALPESDTSKVPSVYGWIADDDRELFSKYSKHADFMMLDPAFSYARALSYSFNGSVVEFSWKFNNFGTSTCTSVKLNVGSATFNIAQTAESQCFSVPYDKIAGKNAGNADWYVSCNAENVSIKTEKLDLPRISNIRFNKAKPLLVGDNVTFRWDVVGTGPFPAVTGAIFCNHTQVAKIKNVLPSSKKGSVQVVIPQYCAGGILWFNSDAGYKTFEVENVQLESVSCNVDYLNSKLSVKWKMNFSKAAANRASSYEISVNVFNTTKIANATDNGFVMDLTSVSSTGTSSVTINKPNFVFHYNWPTAKLGGVRRVSLESKSSFFVDNEYATLTIKSVGPLTAPSIVKCGSTVLKTIPKTENCDPLCQIQVSVAGCHLKALTIDVEGVKTVTLKSKLIVLPDGWYIESMKGDLQGADLKLTWTKPAFCNDIDSVFVKCNLDDREWNICSASETIVDFATKFGDEKELKFFRSGVTFPIKHLLPASITFSWKELDDEKGILTWNDWEIQSYVLPSSVKILMNGTIFAQFANPQSSFLIRWVNHPVVDKTSKWQVEIFGYFIDIEPPHKYYSRIENIQMVEKTLWPGDFVSVSWTSAGPVSSKSVSAELRCKDMILNRVENVFNTSRIQVQVHEECKESGILFQSDAGTEMISVSHMKLYELTMLNYKIDYLEGLMEVSCKLNSDEEESNRVTEMNVTLFGVEQQINAKQQTINLDLTEMDLKQSNQLTFSQSHMKFQYSWPNVKLGGVRQVKLDSLPNEIEVNHKLNVHLIMKSELIAPVICKCGDNVLLTVSDTVVGTSTYSIPVGICGGKNVSLDVEGIEIIVLVPFVTLKPDVTKNREFPLMLVAICSGAGGLLLIIGGLISWHCYRVRKRKRQAALLRAFGSGKLHIFHIGKFK